MTDLPAKTPAIDAAAKVAAREQPPSSTAHLAVAGLIVVAILSVILVGVLAYSDRDTPELLGNVAAGCVGALATLVSRVGAGRINGA
jgi:hypothetical protein